MDLYLEADTEIEVDIEVERVNVEVGVVGGVIVCVTVRVGGCVGDRVRGGVRVKVPVAVTACSSLQQNIPNWFPAHQRFATETHRPIGISTRSMQLALDQLFPYCHRQLDPFAASPRPAPIPQSTAKASVAVQPVQIGFDAEVTQAPTMTPELHLAVRPSGLHCRVVLEIDGRKRDAREQLTPTALAAAGQQVLLVLVGPTQIACTGARFAAQVATCVPQREAVPLLRVPVTKSHRVITRRIYEEDISEPRD